MAAACMICLIDKTGSPNTRGLRLVVGVFMVRHGRQNRFPEYQGIKTGWCAVKMS